MKEVVSEVLGPEARSLACTLKKLTTENLILTHKNKGLRKAVFIKKSRRKRGKPLFKLFREESKTKAMFFSLTKI
jgi:DNA-binding transcriptional regulator GbsR (MarR family)